MAELSGLREQLQRVEEEYEQLRAKNSTLREALLAIIEESNKPGHTDPVIKMKSLAMSALEDEAEVERPNLEGL